VKVLFARPNIPCRSRESDLRSHCQIHQSPTSLARQCLSPSRFRFNISSAEKQSGQMMFWSPRSYLVQMRPHLIEFEPSTLIHTFPGFDAGADAVYVANVVTPIAYKTPSHCHHGVCSIRRTWQTVGTIWCAPSPINASDPSGGQGGRCYDLEA